MKNKKILFFSHDSYLHGATRSLIDLADFIRNEDFETKIIIPSTGIAGEILTEKNIAHEVLFYPLLINYGQHSTFAQQLKKLVVGIKYLLHIIKSIRKFNPGTIYINSSVNYWLLIIKFFIKKPIILHIREFGKEDHAIYYDFNGFLFRFFKSKVFFISNSLAVKNHFDRKFKIRSHVIYNGVISSEGFNVNRTQKELFRKKSDRSIIKLGIVGNITKNKGQLNVLKAFYLLSKEYSRIELIIVGGGDISILNEYIKSKQLLSKVHITGFLKNIEDYYLDIDILIANSTMEAFGRVVVEASSYAIPVIARNSGGIPEIIIDNKTGILHDGTVFDIYNKIKKLIDDEKLRKQLGETGWYHTKELFNIEKSIGAFTSILNKTLSKEF